MLQSLEFSTNVDKFDPNIFKGVHHNSSGNVFKVFGTYVPANEFYCLFFAREVEPGIYETGLNFNHDIEFHANRKVNNRVMGYDKSNQKILHYGELPEDWDNLIGCYGVADNVEQVKEYFKPIIDNPNVKAVISMTPIEKADEPANGGWRWHKWGPYIGTQNTTTEYIHDEPEIEMVYVFHIYFLE